MVRFRNQFPTRYITNPTVTKVIEEPKLFASDSDKATYIDLCYHWPSYNLELVLILKSKIAKLVNERGLDIEMIIFFIEMGTKFYSQNLIE